LIHIAESARLDCHAGCVGGGMQIISSGQRIIFGVTGSVHILPAGSASLPGNVIHDPLAETSLWGNPR